MLDYTQRVNLIEQALSNTDNAHDYWETIKDNLPFIVDNLTMFTPSTQADETFSPEAERHFLPLAILSTWKPEAFDQLLNAFGENKIAFLNKIFAPIPNGITLFETALLLSPQTTRLAIAEACMKHGFSMDKLALENPNLYNINNTITLSTLQKAFMSGDIGDYLLDQMYHSEPYYHPAFLRLAYNVFGASMCIEELEIISEKLAKEARINYLKQQLNGFKDPLKYWKIIETDNNIQLILNNISMFIPPVLMDGTLEAGARNYFTPLAMMCTRKPEAFGTLLQALGPHNLEFLSEILCYNGNSITLFETTLILTTSSTCLKINEIYKASGINLQPITDALNTCCELNNLIYSINDPQHLSKLQERFQPYNKKTTLTDICNQISHFPTCYHAAITHLAHTAFNFSLDVLEANLINFKSCLDYCTKARRTIALKTANVENDQTHDLPR